jgi:hypothetical protein
MDEIAGFRREPLLAHVIEGALQVGSIPKNDGGDEQVETAGPWRWFS